MKKIQVPFFRTPFNYDTDEASDLHGLKCEDPSLAKQEFLEESKVTYIAERFGLTGEMPQVLDLPEYGDYTGVFDFQTAMNVVIEGQRQFMTLPAKVRARFENQPQQLLEFLNDEENRDEAERLGLIPKGGKLPAAQSSATTGATDETGNPSTTGEATQTGTRQGGTTQGAGTPPAPEKPGRKAT